MNVDFHAETSFFLDNPTESHRFPAFAKMSDSSDLDHRLRDEENDSAESDDGDGLLDVEAAESDGEQDSEAEESEIVPFPQFLRLPLELRIRIWEMFCPDLTCNARILEFDVSPCSAAYAHAPGRPKSLRNCLTPKEGITLEGQTLPLRDLLAVHSESRALALKAFPETLSMDVTPDSIVSFNSDKDVVLIKGHRGPERKYDFPEFGHKVKQLAVVMDNFDKSKFPSLLRHFPNLKRVFFLGADSDFKRRDLQWTGSEYLHSYQLTSHEDLSGFRQNVDEMFFWPNVDERPDWSKIEVPRLHLKFVQEEVIQAVEERGLEHYLMVSFDAWNIVPRYKEPKQAPGNWQSAFSDLDPLTSESDSESGSASEPPSDHYESDGIDDNEIVEEDESSEDELVPNAISPGSLNGYGARDDNLGTAAPFSSIEPESADEDGDNKDDGGLPSRGRKRRVISDSEDEEDGPAAPPAKRSRTARVALDSDDEEEGPSHQARGTRGAPAVISDSETDGGGDGAKTTGRAVAEDSSEEGESEEDAPPARMTLAERLQQFRDENPVPESGDEGSSSHKSYDSDGNSLMPNSDDGEEDDDEDSEDGLVDEMADDSNGEGEDESDEGW